MAVISGVLTITNTINPIQVVNGSYMVQNTITIVSVIGTGMLSTNANSSSTITTSVTVPRPNDSNFIGTLFPYGKNIIVGKWS